MTSMPASRSARAMIFAPRSCPSRPGLATTTRIRRPEDGMPAAYPLRVDAAAPQSRARRVQTLLILGALSAFGPLSIDMYLPALPGLARDFGDAPSAVQVTLTTCLAGLALGQILAGPVSDARGRRPP